MSLRLARGRDSSIAPSARFHVRKSEAKGLVFHVLEFCGRVKTRDRQMVFRRTQVLSHCEDVDLAPTEIAENFDQLLHRLA